MISRERLSSDVHQELLREIIQGRFSPGQRLRDAELAENLGVSRTPVREALLRLEREGFISAQQHMGFSVKELQESEIREVYPLVRLLECAALVESAGPFPEGLERLEELGSCLEEEGSDPLRRIELDSTWHGALLEGEANGHLKRILTELKRILFRYEYAFMQDDRLVSESAAEHAAILAALRRGDRERAVALLAAHWERCAQATLADFLANRGAAKGQLSGLASRAV
ncbi:MAG: GntR family transcriptional regulator [Spirochaetaceae bacterium]|nr:GntR family transcriptional regulator [Spirochaetaceae bacterium]